MDTSRGISLGEAGSWESQILLRGPSTASMPFPVIIGKSPTMQEVARRTQRLAELRDTVILTGETGTGKELIARALHLLGSRGTRPFIPVNTSVIPPDIAASELFGHERGAYTTALATKRGYFELAEGGTVFLDEIAEMSMEVQTHLLRVVEQKEFFRVGGSTMIRADFRLIVGTNKDLRKEVDAGRFRQDLFARLNVFPIRLPALRHRGEDVLHLVDYYLDALSQKMHVLRPMLSDSVIERVKAYHWPDNIRELEHMFLRAILEIDGREIIFPDDLEFAPAVSTSSSLAEYLTSISFENGYTHIVEGFKKALIEEALRRAEGVHIHAATLANMGYRKLRYLMRKFGLR